MAITGKPSLAYIGVEAATPPNMVVNDRDPNTRDLAAYRLGDYWLNRGTQNAPLQRLFILTSKANNIAQWALIIAGGGGATLTITPDGGTPVSPVLGNITFDNADTNLIFSNGGPGLILVDFNNSIFVQNNITTLDGLVNVGSRNPLVGPTIITNASNGGGILAPGDSLVHMEFMGFNGVTYETGSAITSRIDPTGAVPLMPANLAFWTKPNSVQPLTQRMEIRSTGEIFIAAPDGAPVQNALTVDGNILTTDDGSISTTNAGMVAGSQSNVANVFSSFATVRHRAGNNPVVLGDGLGAFAFFGQTTAGGLITTGAAIASTVDSVGAVGLNQLPANITFSTHPNLALIPPAETRVRMTIASGGQVSINAPDTITDPALVVDGEIRSSLGITTTNGGIIAGAVSDTPPNDFSTVGTLLSHVGNLPVATGDILGAFSFLGTTVLGTINHGASISSVVTGAVALNQLPSNITFSTHPAVPMVPPAELLLRMTIASTGETSINLSDSGISFQVAGSVGVNGDQGGIAAGATFTGVADLTANGAGTFTVKSKTANNLDSAGFLKIYINNVPFFIPVFTSVGP